MSKVTWILVVWCWCQFIIILLSLSEQCGSLYQWRVPEPSPGQSPVSFVFLLGGNYTGQNNFLFPPSLQSFSSHLQPHWVLHKLSDNSNYNSLNHRHSNGATLLTINERLLPTNLRTFVNKRIKRKPSFYLGGWLYDFTWMLALLPSYVIWRKDIYSWGAWCCWCDIFLVFGVLLIYMVDSDSAAY